MFGKVEDGVVWVWSRCNVKMFEVGAVQPIGGSHVRGGDRNCADKDMSALLGERGARGALAVAGVSGGFKPVTSSARFRVCCAQLCAFKVDVKSVQRNDEPVRWAAS
jgi:hypothetical protein